MNTDQFRGRLEGMIGRIQEFAGRAVDSKPLVEHGRIAVAVGLARAKFGDVKEAARKRALLSPRGRRSTT